jgi:hypothetical protein
MIMKTLILSFALWMALAPAAAVAQEPAEIWNGALVDWDCKLANVEEVCAATKSSRRFALSVDGGVLLFFDDRGNELALEAIRQANADAQVEPTVLGRREGRLLKVESIQIGSVHIS